MKPKAVDGAVPWMMAAVRPAGQRVVIVGGGAVARRRAEMFSRQGAAVRVFDPFGNADEPWPEGVKFSKRRVSQRDLQNSWLVIVATNDPQVNDRVANWAHELGLEVNRADDVNLGTFAVPAVIEDPAGWQLAILGGDAGPLFSTWLRGVLQITLGLPKIEFVYNALSGARSVLKDLPDLTQEQRTSAMRRVMARALESDEPLDPKSLIQELLP